MQLFPPTDCGLVGKRSKDGGGEDGDSEGGTARTPRRCEDGCSVEEGMGSKWDRELARSGRSKRGNGSEARDDEENEEGGL